MSEELLRVEHLKKYFKTGNGFLHAVDDVNLSIKRGETLGVVGESGCGKSTLGRVLLGLLDSTDGKIFFHGKDITDAKGKERKQLRKQMQIIFQDPFSSLNPRHCVADIIAAPLKSYHVCANKSDLDKRVFELMDAVELDRRFAYAYPHEMDGGRRQRVGIARALALNPEFIVCDEPVSALDVSVQAQILNLLMDLQEKQGLTYVFITHDLSVVSHISTNILVMYVGCMVEKCSADALFEKQLHPYTKGLLSAIPIPTINREKKRIIMQGELTSPVNPKPGCRFASRCAWAKEKCFAEQPVFEEVEPEHFVACHYVREINGLSEK